jgi:hypothetical protein
MIFPVVNGINSRLAARIELSMIRNSMTFFSVAASLT